MNYTKKINNFYKLGNIKLEEGKAFNKHYNKQYNKRKNIAKDHFLLANAFNITRLIKKTNNNKITIPENFYFQENKNKYKLNIFNYKKAYDNLNLKINTNEDELLRTLLIKIDSKNIEELLKYKERMVNLQRRALRGLSYKLEPITYNNTKWKTFNKTNSLKSYSNYNNQSNYKSKDSLNFNNQSNYKSRDSINLNNQSNYKSKDSINFNTSSKLFKNNNSLSIETTYHNREKYIRNYTLPKRFYTQPMSEKMKGIFQTINIKEKMIEKNSNILNYNVNLNNNTNLFRTFKEEKLNLKANSIKNEKSKKRQNLNLKNVSKIKHKKDLEKILFTQNKFLFKKIKNDLHTLYKKGKKIPSEYLEQ